MRNFLLYAFIVNSFLFCTTIVQAQIQLGGGLTYGTGISKLGLQIKGTYEIQEKLIAAPGVNFFFKDKALSDVSINYYSIDLDAHYRLIAVGDDVQIYPIGGLNIFNVKINGPTTGIRVRDDGVKVGLNLGLGAQIATLSDWNYFGEFKYTVGGIDQSTITAGVLYGF